MTKFTRLQVEGLEDRCTPSASFEAPPALAHLSAALDRVGHHGPPIRVSPVFALNFGNPTPATLHALHGLVTASAHITTDPIIPVDPAIPPNPISPVFYGLANYTPSPTL